MSQINGTNQQLINELRARGLYLLVLGPADFKEYEIAPGTKVPMSEQEAVQLIARAEKQLDNVLMEHAWDVVHETVYQFKREKEKAALENTDPAQHMDDDSAYPPELHAADHDCPPDAGQDRESYSDTQDRKSYSSDEG